MKHIKLFENYQCVYFSDAARMNAVEEVLNKIKNDDTEDFIDEPDYDMLIDPYDGYEKQTYIQYVEEDNELIYWEGWSKYCWSGLYAKKEYKGLSKEKAVRKLVQDRLIPALESMGLTYSSYEFFFHESDMDGVPSNYILSVKFTIN